MLQIDELQIKVLAEPAMPQAAQDMIAKTIASYKDQDLKLSSDPEKNEGLDQLWTKAKALEAERDRALNRGPSFDYASACLQITIVLASVAIISSGSMLLVVSGILGLAGAALTLNGFTMAMPLVN